jgi:hypothetical protein
MGRVRPRSRRHRDHQEAVKAGALPDPALALLLGLCQWSNAVAEHACQFGHIAPVFGRLVEVAEVLGSEVGAMRRVLPALGVVDCGAQLRDARFDRRQAALAEDLASRAHDRLPLRPGAEAGNPEVVDLVAGDGDVVLLNEVEHVVETRAYRVLARFAGHASVEIVGDGGRDEVAGSLALELAAVEADGLAGGALEVEGI